MRILTRGEVREALLGEQNLAELLDGWGWGDISAALTAAHLGGGDTPSQSSFWPTGVAFTLRGLVGLPEGCVMMFDHVGPVVVKRIVAFLHCMCHGLSLGMSEADIEVWLARGEVPLQHAVEVVFDRNAKTVHITWTSGMGRHRIRFGGDDKLSVQRQGDPTVGVMLRLVHAATGYEFVRDAGRSDDQVTVFSPAHLVDP